MWRCARVFCAVTLAVSIISPFPLAQAASTAVRLCLNVIVPSLQRRQTFSPAQREGAAARRNDQGEVVPHPGQARRIRIELGETRDVPFTIAFASIIVVSPEIAAAQIKNGSRLILTGLRVGETILIASDSRGRHTFVVEVAGRPPAATRHLETAADTSTALGDGLSGSYALTYTAPAGGSPALLSQNFEMRRTLSQGRVIRFSSEMHKFSGRGDGDLVRAAANNFGLNRISLGVDSPAGSLDFMDSQLSVSPLSFNNYAMRGLHLVSTPGSRLRGIEVFAGLARPSVSHPDDGRGRLAGVVLPLAQGESWRVRAGVLAVSTQRDKGAGAGGAVLQLDGRYAPGRNITAEGEAVYANGGLSWRARLDLRRNTFNASGEIVRSQRSSPLVSIGAQPGGRRSEALAFQWLPGGRFNSSVSYHRTAIEPLTNGRLRADSERTTLLAGVGYRITQNSRLGLRFTGQRIETGTPRSDSRFQLETRTVTVNHHFSYKRKWSNSFEARLNSSREVGANAETERGFHLREQLRFSWRRGSATGFVNYTRKSPSLAGLIVRNPLLLPPLLQRAFAADPARFLQTNREELARLLPGIELPQTRSLDAGVRLQAAFSRYTVAGEVRHSAGEFQSQAQRSLLASVSASIRLDAANSVQVSGARSFVAGGPGGQVGATVSYVHRFGAGSGGGFQFSKLLGSDRGVIQGRVFFDGNGNGHEDAGEQGLPGMRVQIDGDQRATTDAGGGFRFQIKSGEYSVALLSNELGVRLRASTLTEQKVFLSGRQTINLSFGVSNYGTLAGRVFNDLLLTGNPSAANMPGIAGVRLLLHPSEPNAADPVIKGTVDASGAYEFRNLRPGHYSLRLDAATLPANFRLPAPAVWAIRIEPLKAAYLDIPLIAHRALSGVVFFDLDEDGRYDPLKDEAVEGARVMAGPEQTLSGAGGLYLLRNLPAGRIEVRARAPRGGQSLPLAFDLATEPTTRRAVNLAVTR